VAYEIALSVLLIVVLLLLGIPVFVAFGLGTLLMAETTNALPMQIFSVTLFESLNTFALIAVPLFILTGDIVVESGFSKRLLDFVESLVGGLRTGLGTATIGGCGLFATISGSNAADAAALGRIMINRLDDIGYPRSYAASMIASGASTGILIPPSISYILVGIVLGISSATLFKAAFVPGVLIIVGLAVVNVALNWSHGYETNRGRAFSIRGVLTEAWDAKFGLMIPFIILGGIYAGVFTPTEAAAVAVIATVLLGIPAGELELADFPGMFERSTLVNGYVAPILAVATVLSRILTIEGIPQQIVTQVTSISSNFYVITLIIMGILLVAGAVMETTPNIVILAPLLLPVGQEIGMDPIHFTVYFITCLGIGFITPPIGLNLYVLSGVSGEPVTKIARAGALFLVSMILVALLIGWIPAITMWSISG
jgi:tripartite ATP-independent transporter DctM subunit